MSTITRVSPKHEHAQGTEVDVCLQAEVQREAVVLQMPLQMNDGALSSQGQMYTFGVHVASTEVHVQ